MPVKGTEYVSEQVTEKELGSKTVTIKVPQKVEETKYKTVSYPEVVLTKKDVQEKKLVEVRALVEAGHLHAPARTMSSRCLCYDFVCFYRARTRAPSMFSPLRLPAPPQVDKDIQVKKTVLEKKTVPYQYEEKVVTQGTATILVPKKARTHALTLGLGPGPVV